MRALARPARPGQGRPGPAGTPGALARRQGSGPPIGFCAGDLSSADRGRAVARARQGGIVAVRRVGQRVWRLLGIFRV